MILRLLSLEWKQFFRSKTLGQSLVVKIIVGFFALYLIASFLFLGISAYFAIEELFPGEDPLKIVNGFLIYWFLADLTYRFFMQKLPVMNVKPFMLMPFKRNKIIHYLLVKSAFSFFTFLPLFFFFPFFLVLLFKGYPPLLALNWFLTMLLLELCINYVNFFINKHEKLFYIVLGTLLILAGLEYWGIYAVTAHAGAVFNWIYAFPLGFLIPGVVFVFLYYRLFRFLRRGFYLDDQIKTGKKEAREYNLSWLDRFGKTSVFLKNDIRMILRNKRPRQVLLTSFLFLFYGLIFIANPSFKDNYTWMTFGALFVTGGFLMTFGQLVPSWDSEYYKMLMSQNISYRKYLESKWYLMAVGTLLSFLLSTPYLYFGWKVFALITGVAVFNIGLNTFVTLWGGAINRIPVELNVKAKAFSNMQGFNVAQLLWALPKMVLPILLFVIPNYFWGFRAGIIALILSGVLGLICKNFLLTQIEKVYQKGKYKTIAAYSEKA